MGAENFGPLLDELKAVRTGFNRMDALERSINELLAREQLPGAEGNYFDRERDLERKDAIGLCLTRHMLQQPKDDGVVAAYTPSSADIELALSAKRGLERLFRTGELGLDWAAWGGQSG